MSRYTPVSADAPPSYPPRPVAQRSGTTSSVPSSRNPDRELEAAFDDSDDDDDDENLPLSQTRGGRDLVWDAGEDAGLPDEDRAVSAPAPAPAPADGIADPLRSSAAAAAAPPAVAPASLQSTDAEPTYDFDRDYVSPRGAARRRLVRRGHRS